MTPERLQEIRMFLYGITRRKKLNITSKYLVVIVKDLLEHIDAREAEIAALRRGQGRAHDAPPVAGRLHETHPIPNSRSDT